jgi:hypothetical protein
MEPTMTRVQPVAQGGMEAKIGAKKMEMKKQMPEVMAVIPVLPPSEIPAPDSIKAVTGERPKRDPIVIPKARRVRIGAGLRRGKGTYHQPSKLQQSLQNPG